MYDDGNMVVIVLVLFAIVALAMAILGAVTIRRLLRRLLGWGGDNQQQQQQQQQRGGGGGMLGGVSVWRLLTNPLLERVGLGGGGRGGWVANRPDSLPSADELEAMARTLRTSAAQRRTTQREEQHGRDQQQPGGPRGDGEGDGDDQCPVCLDTMISAVELLPCGHHVCASCLLSMRHHNGGLRRLACPLDRTPAEALIPAFTYRQQLRRRYGQQVDEDLERRQDQDLLTYNQSFAHTTTFAGLVSLLRRLPEVARFLPWAVQIRAALTVLGGLLYTASPLDIIPEAIFGLAGLIDDALVVLIVVVVLANIARNAWQVRR